MTRPAPAGRLDGGSQTVDGRGRFKSAPVAACLECGEPYDSGKAGRRFCSLGCSRAFNNRRAVRGVALYDLFMAWRYERSLAASLHVWRAMCRYAAQWRADDVARRQGRPSWTDVRDTLGQRPYLTGDRGRL